VAVAHRDAALADSWELMAESYRISVVKERTLFSPRLGATGFSVKMSLADCAAKFSNYFWPSAE
jgi:hypothetical protein